MSVRPYRATKRTFSAALCRGLIEAMIGRVGAVQGAPGFSAALCRGLIEAPSLSCTMSESAKRFPRLYAAASLKLVHARSGLPRPRRFPRLYAAASLKQHNLYLLAKQAALGFPRLYAAASLKHGQRVRGGADLRGVFRGFMPRPH